MTLESRQKSFRAPTDDYIPLSRRCQHKRHRQSISYANKATNRHQIGLRCTNDRNSHSFIPLVLVQRTPFHAYYTSKRATSPSTHMESGTELLSIKEATRLKRIPAVRQLLATLKLGVDP
ncbi:hypothetical protein M422DRAFT_272769 [Sphaerobolus stellatus SS14]|uniref:Uncharacterized protein n=1 Tax=Sphaerobolus stellatus (strain SS14) TaxID=990650 RepID=A0A0C9TAQ2_SPHS4|nr:hypothetical protein M422DRAFT_272769 [Sphaerobolus stellatus SS14]